MPYRLDHYVLFNQEHVIYCVMGSLCTDLSPLVLNVGFLTNYHQLRRRTAQYCVGASSRLVVLSQKAHIQCQRGYTDSTVF